VALDFGPHSILYGISDERILIGFGGVVASIFIARPGAPVIFLPFNLDLTAFNRSGEVVGVV
jgi:hypothetical protein